MKAGGAPPATRVSDVAAHGLMLRRSMKAGGAPPATRDLYLRGTDRADDRSMKAGGAPPATLPGVGAISGCLL